MNIKMLTSSIILLAVVSIGGCATEYQKSGFSGGFSEVQLAENRFRVSFMGNGFIGAEKVRNYALLRSAELCLEKGYKYFVIIDENNSIKNSTIDTPVTANTSGSIYGNSYNSNTTFSGGQSYNISKPGSTNTIDCLESKPVGVFSYEAQFIIRSIEK
tara:strand:- start:194 stop:667 length:474 start_codon:yes stop_codon:yes gene_type:complete